ncbi:MAG TPA: flagellar hook capping FlgD N-terminal domain-containing protein [Phycisphaerae bacterium]|nr:flagellar hook capping FlgD N-terminal domain-containing protein [Phycisphaerae bacterium]HOJ74297.1 flagellar hook capping FlgD N-terminal domain-containing protein [Phycisphaerae bacterium]HOM51376.1 flagellar hook capping FlgD N-terminal domain-containing protein [Phycisphaerae bacterium]HON66914.1 flagellar hook capping FlgD N-terminal domain-containing protein [Phycisphaerae bacterium]HOQ84993.1 flagellar hook capping FlgD N-terminal domain-containing protein [Phycisphaerae bacterium]
METTSISGVSASTNSTSAATAAGLGGISSEEFLNILVKQLQMQDPMEPMTNQEMLAQLSTIRELEMNTRLSRKLEQLTDQQRFGSAAALIGKHVKGTVADSEGNEFVLEGIVTGVRFTEKGEVMLELDTGETLPLTKLELVTDADGTVLAAA